MSDARAYYAMTAALFQHPELTRESLQRQTWEWMLNNGRVFTGMDTARSKTVRKRHSLQSNRCYWNCQLMAQVDDRYEYWEGHATAIIPVQHAWLVDHEG